MARWLELHRSDEDDWETTLAGFELSDDEKSASAAEWFKTDPKWKTDRLVLRPDLPEKPS
ncbi:MAG TPA: hypothetical protein VHB20_12320 [Verrucomicrobiae bacterium]|jgi:hypothetical protein|nr:hypothetical protein [Verrucomicrobiae bacterium]